MVLGDIVKRKNSSGVGHEPFHIILGNSSTLQFFIRNNLVMLIIHYGLLYFFTSSRIKITGRCSLNLVKENL
jgi:hypothetical protein